ncbi:YD repeat-containing protein [Jejuia pallidilutea]|uniref:YD repeat-containing protein n=1 Tax=Jejuia pallidilutea TaxID=504487 RepID=A0A362X7E2_9FLAO|nr:RHS repeat domain-containing protein [Jejuia pallidilutea]PQV44585.1 YD repeat-containing protein [Jejuia pallidilutea]
MNTRFLILIFLASTVRVASAQDLPEIIPPSPEVASFGKFSEVPISHYTGLPNISVPFTSFSVGEKSFPVSLSYHARGIKVEEIASRAGIGWALNAGGSISRQTRDKPDDGDGGYINRGNILMDALASGSFFTNKTVRTNYETADAYASTPPDRFPDQFNISAGSLSAKFIFSYVNDEPLVQNFSDIHIQYNMGNITQAPFGTNLILSFVVTDKDGYKYYFGVSKDGLREARNWDKNIGNYTFPSNSSYNLTSSPFYLNFNSWQLMDVESPNSELVSFVYQEETSIFHSRSYDKKENNGTYTNYTSKIESHQYQLKEIIHKQGKIILEANDDRQDLNGGKELDFIKIYDNNLSSIKTFNLYHSYPATVTDNNQHSQLISFESQAAKRIFLDSIVEVGKNNTKKPAYVFTYNDQALPHRFSNSQDLWGFYNGKPNGQYLKFFGPYNQVSRQVDIEKSMAGMLEQVKYPTGGFTKFIFEHNIGHLGDEFNHILIPDVNSVEPKSAALSHFDHAFYNNGKYEKNIEISNISGPLKIDVSLPVVNGVNQNWACGNPIQNDCMFSIDLIGINGNPFSYSYIFSGYQEFYVESGDYKLVFDPHHTLNWDPSPLNAPLFMVGLSWEDELFSSGYLYAAGKRIKKIQFYDSNYTLVSEKAYDYKHPDGSESGVILSLPFFGALEPNTNLNLTVFQPRGAFPGSPFKTYQGNTIGYKKVTEYYGSSTNNHGKTEYEFMLNKDSGGFMNYPITPPTDNEWLRGLPIYIKHYKLETNGSYRLLKNTYNEYLHADQYLLPQIFTPVTKVLPLLHNDPWVPGTDLSSEGLLYNKTNTSYRLPFINLRHAYETPDVHDYDYKIYHFTGGTLGNVKIVETLYDDNENPTLVTQTETEFNYQKHYQPALVKSVSSDEKPIIQTFTYPQDLVTSYDIHPRDANGNLDYSSIPDTALVEQHRVVPLLVKKYKDTNTNGIADSSELLNTTETVYAWDISDSHILEPSLIKTGKGSNSAEDRIEFKDYDADGNLLQVSKTEGTDITYIYGYDKTLPIAKIENGTYSQVSGQVTSLQALSNSDDDRTIGTSGNEGSLRTALNNLRNSLPNAMVTTYTYDPLIGLTSITDPKGYTSYYEYDGFNRLIRVKDANGNILSENEYYYAAQN